MKNIAFVMYRSWAARIYENICEYEKETRSFHVPLVITTKEHEFPLYKNDTHVVNGGDNDTILTLLRKYKIDTVFYYGWSWMVKEPILSEFRCVCLHPSPLPKYRGGSPIQHQIINGESVSAVTLFRMGEGIDDGDIYYQVPISLEGTLEDIFSEIVDKGSQATKKLIEDIVKNNVSSYPQQNLKNYPALKRRRPEESMVTLDLVAKMQGADFNNLIRALDDPYPNTCIVLGSKKIFIKQVSYTTTLPENGRILNEGELPTEKGSHYILTADGYVCLLRFDIK